MNAAMVLEPRSRNALQEAMREIQVMSGITSIRRPQVMDELDVAVGAEGLGTGGLDVTPGSALLRMRMRPQAVAHHARPSVEAATRPLAIGVTSAGFGDGKTTLSIALASSLAYDLGAQVTLVDADFTTQSLAREYGLEGKAGLTDVLNGSVALPAAVHRFLRTPLNVVAAGTSDEDASRMARSNELVQVLDHLKAISGFVVLDLPATLQSMNAPVLAQRCDGVIVVARSGRTTRSELERVLALLRDAHILGVVVNRDRTSIPRWVERALDLRR